MTRRKSSGLEKTAALRLDLYIAFIFFAIPLGWSMSGFAPNIVLACVCWAVSLMLAIHAFWIYKGTSIWPFKAKAIIALIGVAGTVAMAWKPVIAEYQKEHYVIDKERFISVLRSQKDDRYPIRLGCPENSEEACVIAGHFLDLFKEAGWHVEGNEVEHVRLGKPEAGILLMLHGTGVLNPDNPSSGLWVLQSKSLSTVRSAFKAISIQAGERADSNVPERLIAIHFGHNTIEH